MSSTRTVITFGTFDVFHVGHLRVIERAAALAGKAGPTLGTIKQGMYARALELLTTPR